MPWIQKGEYGSYNTFKIKKKYFLLFMINKNNDINNGWFIKTYMNVFQYVRQLQSWYLDETIQ